MRKLIFVLLLVCLGAFLFAQESSITMGVGYQYGFSRIKEDGDVIRELNEPGLVGTIRMESRSVGFFGRIGVLFPSSVTENGLTFDYSNYNYILFFNTGFGPSFTIPFSDRFSVVIDLGLSINDLTYGGSYRDTINASWQRKFETMDTVYYYWSGHEYQNIKIKERYNDVSMGILGNVGFNVRVSRNLSLQLAMAVSYDFLRIRSYRFFADFKSGSNYDDRNWPVWALDDFPEHLLTIDDDGQGNKTATELVLESNSQFDTFKQFTFLPSISVIFSF